jgi:hypothetical protein
MYKSLKKHGFRYCKTCQSKLQKDGHTPIGKQRYRCPVCTVSKVNNRSDLTRSFVITRFVSLLLGKLSQSELDGATRTFRDKVSWCWGIVPTPTLTGEIHEVVIIDGIRVAGMTCLIARTPKYVLNWIWAPYETTTYWGWLLSTLPTPKYVVCDGQRGMLGAISICWGTSVIQRCRFHVWLNIKAKLTLNPESIASKELLQIGRDLLQISSSIDADKWKDDLKTWYKTHEDYVNEKTVRTNPLLRQRRSFPTHARLLSAYKQLVRIVDDVLVFAYHLDPNFPATTNSLEGGVNSQIRTQIKLHRGMNYEHQKRLVEWYLCTRTEGAKSPRKCL